MCVAPRLAGELCTLSHVRLSRRPQIPRTLDNTREVEETAVQANDEEVVADEAEDEFAPYFAGTKAR